MRLEHIPLIIGAIVALIGLGFIADASMAAAAPVTPERRRRIRAEPSRTGEAIVGIGTLCMAAALFGRDTWRYGTVSVLVGSVLLLIGVILNRGFLKEALLFRGPARRSEEGVPNAKPGTGALDVHRRHPPAQPGPPISSRGSGSGTPVPATGGTVRHPTPPLASRAYRPTDPPAPPPTPTPARGQARLDAASSPARPSSGPADAGRDSSAAPAPRPAPPPPSSPPERRKTPRGKR